MLKIVCFKWKHKGGFRLPSLSVIGKYTAAHVNNLYHAFQKYLTIPHEFICITDDNEGVECRTIPLWDKCMEYGGCYNRLYVFSRDMKELIGDRFVCIDLDTVITANVDSIFSRTEPFIINKFYGGNPRQFYNGALFMMDAGVLDKVWTEFAENIEGNIHKLNLLNRGKQLLGTDQAWISYILGRGIPMFTNDHGIIPYRRLEQDNRGKKLPSHAKIIFFAGANDPSIKVDIDKWVRDYWSPTLTKEESNRVEFDKKVSDIRNEVFNNSPKLGYVPNIFEPKSLSEKTKWRKFFSRNPLMGMVVDKIKVYEYVKERLGNDKSLIPVVQITEKPEELNFRNFPDKCVIKTNHVSGKVIFFEKGKTSVLPIIYKLKEWLSKPYDDKKNEWPYSQIKPGIIVQEFIGNGAPPIDYKIHIMNGKCTWIEIYSDRYNPKKEQPKLIFYTPTWEVIPANSKKYRQGEEVPKPKELSKMIKMAEKLGEPFDYVRVDLYLIGSQIYFGELTFFPHSGNFNFIPTEFDFEIGKKLNLTLNG